MAQQQDTATDADQIVQRLVAQHEQTLSNAAHELLSSVLRSILVRSTTKMQLCNAAQLTRIAPAAGAPLPAVAVDEELTTLRQEVQQKHAALHGKRRAVPDCIFNDTRQLLEGARPPTNASPLPGGAAEAEPAAEAQLTPAPQLLQAQLAASLTNLPELRARLSEAVGRLERVVAAAGPAVDPQPASPAAQQVKSAVGGKRPAVSPAFEEAMRSGKIATRRRLRDKLSGTAPRDLGAYIAAQ